MSASPQRPASASTTVEPIGAPRRRQPADQREQQRGDHAAHEHARGQRNLADPRGRRPAGKISAASPSPMSAANTHSRSDSASTSVVTAPSVNPSVFSTASSGMRSRTDCIIVLPVRNSSVNITAPTMAFTMKPMSPICLICACANSFSFCVFVSSGELANSLSTRRAIAADCVGSLMLNAYQPTWPWPKLRASSK